MRWSSGASWRARSRARTASAWRFRRERAAAFPRRESADSGRASKRASASAAFPWLRRAHASVLSPVPDSAGRRTGEPLLVQVVMDRELGLAIGFSPDLHEQPAERVVRAGEIRREAHGLAIRRLGRLRAADRLLRAAQRESDLGGFRLQPRGLLQRRQRLFAVPFGEPEPAQVGEQRGIAGMGLRTRRRARRAPSAGRPPASSRRRAGSSSPRRSRRAHAPSPAASTRPRRATAAPASVRTTAAARRRTGTRGRHLP